MQKDFILSLGGSVLIFAIVEEYFKYLINPFLSYKKPTYIGETIVNCLYIGLAFSFIENILFFMRVNHGGDFLYMYVYRSLFTTLMHVSASGILGYFYGLSFFSKSILTRYEIENAQYNVLSFLHKFAKKTGVFKSVSVTQGFFIAAIVHALFNLFLYLELRVLAAIMISLFSFFIVYLLNRENVQLQYGIIGSREMPEKDFEELRLKISVLKHLKNIHQDRPDDMKRIADKLSWKQ